MFGLCTAEREGFFLTLIVVYFEFHNTILRECRASALKRVKLSRFVH